jgi:predicted GNAT superfamily acetyltransferase
MFEWEIGGKRFYIRDVEGEAEFHEIEDIQREAWGFSDLDIVPSASLIASAHAGGVVLCAFEGEKMIGFAFGFPALEHGRPSIHSHMLAVRAEWRNFQAGFYLKLAQRKRVLALGLDEITWTFDPLQSLNAHLNFAKLGVISRRYIVNFYGEATSSPLHEGFGTDRLWVRWLIESDRVKELIERKSKLSEIPASAKQIAPLLVSSEGGLPAAGNLDVTTGKERFIEIKECFIEIPHDITALKQRDPEAARAWREATRPAFLAAIEAGFTVENLLRLNDPSGPRWFYLLSK